jgi:hypothetical protein
MGAEKSAEDDSQNIASYIAEVMIVDSVENLSTLFGDNSGGMSALVSQLYSWLYPLWIMWKTYPHFLGITRKMEHPVPLL